MTKKKKIIIIIISTITVILVAGGTVLALKHFYTLADHRDSTESGPTNKPNPEQIEKQADELSTTDFQGAAKLFRQAAELYEEAGNSEKSTDMTANAGFYEHQAEVEAKLKAEQTEQEEQPPKSDNDPAAAGAGYSEEPRPSIEMPESAP